MKKKKLLPVFVASALSLSCFTAVPIISQAEGATEAPVDRVIMYRLYNPNSGEHFYTGNEGEKNNLIMLGWRDEGIGWIAPATSNTPVYRLYNENAGDHHYTKEADEKDNLISAGWKFEGIGWYSDDNETVPLYREYNSNAVSGTHNYTTDKAEHDSLVAAGWNDENIGWYAIGEGLGAGATQYAFNDFLTYFSEQRNAFLNGFDVNNWKAEDIVDFAYLYLKLHSWDTIGHERINESPYYTLPLAAVNDTLHRFFGITITDTEASSEFSQVPLSRPYGSNTYYMNGRFYFPAADGEFYNDLSIVKQAESLGDGNLRLHFDIYDLDIQEYLENNGKEGYYYLTSEQAAQNRYLTKEKSGIAVVRPYEYNGGHTFQLVSYNIGNGVITEPVDQHPDWSKLYYRFIINKQYMSISQPIYNSEYDSIVFSLHDLDADGTPELIMHNGAGGALATEYVFTCTNGKIKYVGNVGFMGCRLYFYNDKNYPGLFCSDGRQGLYWEEYYSLNDGAIVCQDVEEGEYSGEMEEPIRTKKTNDDALYNLSISGKAIRLQQFTEADIRAMGWDTFVSMYGFAVGG